MKDHTGTPAKIDETMHAIRLNAPTGPAGIVYEQVETPRPGTGEALVRVYAAAITRGELDWPVDRLPATPSYEFSGVVAALGPGVENVAVGEQVYALSGFDRDGAAAEYVIVRAAFLAAKPKTASHVECAAIPLAALSAWQGLFDHGQLRKGQRVLIHGAAGGVGSYAVQLAHQRGAFVIGTASSKNIPAVRELGADEAIDYTRTKVEKTIEPVDLVFDTAGGEKLRRALSVLRAGGRIVSVAEEPPKEAAEAKGISAVYFVVKPSREQLEEIAQLVDNGKVRATVDEVYPLVEGKKAFERSLREHGSGKIVLRVVDEN
jgi:NADPH:quinone reductase-like Zn-dependent oxidoreductase